MKKRHSTSKQSCWMFQWQHFIGTASGKVRRINFTFLWWKCSTVSCSLEWLGENKIKSDEKVKNTHIICFTVTLFFLAHLSDLSITFLFHWNVFKYFIQCYFCTVKAMRCETHIDINWWSKYIPKLFRSSTCTIGTFFRERSSARLALNNENDMYDQHCAI